MPRTKLPSSYWEEVLTKLGLLSPITTEVTYGAKKEEEPQEQLNPEQLAFIDRVVRRLTYSEPMRRKLKKELQDVFLGNLSMDEWIDKTGAALGMKEIDLLKIVREELKPLKGPEIEAVKRSFDMRIQELSRYYP